MKTAKSSTDTALLNLNILELARLQSILGLYYEVRGTELTTLEIEQQVRIDALILKKTEK